MKTDILKLYLGCRVRATFEDDEIEYIQGIMETVGNECATFTHQIPDYYYNEPQFKLQLILRPLSSMTEEEGLDCFGDEWDSDSPNARDLIKNISPDEELRLTPNESKWLLSKGFDLFGLCESGEAIDATKI